MSTIQAANISDGTDTVGTTYVVNGSAKTLINFNAVTVTITSSTNVSSLDDGGTGVYGINFNNDFSSTGWSASSMSERAGSREDQTQSLTSITTGSTTTYWGWPTDVRGDPATCCVQFWGDLA